MGNIYAGGTVSLIILSESKLRHYHPSSLLDVTVSHPKLTSNAFFHHEAPF